MGDGHCGGKVRSDDTAAASAVSWGRLPAAHRRLAHDALPAFRELQAALHSGGVTAPVLQRYAQTISDLLVLDQDTLLAPEAAIWDLLQVALLHTQAGGGVATESLIWLLARHEGALSPGVPLGLAAEELALSEAAVPEAQPGFWETVQRLAALGRAEEAGELLGRHTLWRRAVEAAGDRAVLAQVAVLEAVLALLRSTPRLRLPGAPAVGGGRAHDEPGGFQEARQVWLCGVVAARADERRWGACGDAALAAGARGLLGVLAGDGRALDAATQGWLELLAARLLHKHPTAPLLPDAPALVAECVAAKGGTGPSAAMQAAAGLLAAAAERDAARILAACSLVAAAGSFLLAHAVDLLPPGAPDLPPAAGTPSLPEWYRCEYVGALAAARATRLLAAEVAAWCPRRGRGCVQALLERTPPGEVLRTVRLGRRFGLPGAARHAARAAGAAAAQAGRSAEALGLFLRAGDAAAGAAAVAGLDDGQVADLRAMLEAAGGCGPLAAAREQLRLQRAMAALARGAPAAERAEALAAAKDAVLVLARSAPADALPRILFAVAELLDAAPPVFSEGEVRALVRALGERGGDGPEAQAARLALARGLTRAHVAALCPA
ncbi:hypothetical protein WJX81_002703 [Elliptochloris bilobata]|uniref:Nuclear pore complex protein Nup85 n=1 Tax=Elliptochloris bilobata TaxID=381761 RepID=A0AAW1SIS9_9CHLO